MQHSFMENKCNFILFGAGLRGKLVNEAMKALGKTVIAFTDNDSKKIGSIFCGQSIRALDDILTNEKEMAFVLCIGSKVGKETVRKQLELAGFTGSVFDVEEVLECYHNHILGRQVLSVIESDKLTIEHTLAIVTDKCSLRCKDCGHLVTHYKNPQTYPIEMLIDSIKNFADSVDRIKLLSLLGGEPFLHPQLGEICQEVAKLRNVEMIRLVTNGTIVPKDETLQKIKGSVTYISISNYGNLSAKLDLLIEKLEEFGIIYEVTPENTEWYPIDVPYATNRTKEEVKQLYEQCQWGRGCSAIQAGEFHICNYSTTGTRLGFLRPQPEEFVNLLDENTTCEERKQQIDALLKREEPIKACEYCNFDFTKTIKAAVQK